jgi:DNA-binding NarL/FixJ family response regulator
MALGILVNNEDAGSIERGDNMTEMANIFIADDQADVRSALRLLIEQEPGMRLIGEADNAVGLIKGICESNANIALVDWELPGLTLFADGFSAVVKAHRADVKIVALSGLPGSKKAALAAGADLFISKGDAPEILLAALREISKDVSKEG